MQSFMLRNMMFKLKDIYLSKIVLIHTLFAGYFFVLLFCILLTVEIAESVMKYLTFDFYHDVMYAHVIQFSSL